MTVYWPDKTIYFITGSTFLHFPYFRTNDQKNILFSQMKKIKDALNIPIAAYSIACNHYHILASVENGADISKIKQILHGGTSFEYRRRYKMKYNEMWQSSKILQVKSEEAYWKIMGYIIGNLLKHKEVGTFEMLQKNSFSSYAYIVKKYGENFAKDLVYRIIHVNESSEGVIDFEQLKNSDFIKPSAQAE